MIVDVVTGRLSNLHNENISLMEAAERFFLPRETALYAVAYRPARRGENAEIDLWPATVGVGERFAHPAFGVELGSWNLGRSGSRDADACRRRLV